MQFTEEKEQHLKSEQKSENNEPESNKKKFRLEKRTGHRHMALVDEDMNAIGFVYGPFAEQIGTTIERNSVINCGECFLISRLKRLEYESGRLLRLLKENPEIKDERISECMKNLEIVLATKNNEIFRQE